MRGEVRAKAKCCKERPRCKRCPVVCQRLERAGHVERVGKRVWRADAKVPKKALRAARA